MEYNARVDEIAERFDLLDRNRQVFVLSVLAWSFSPVLDDERFANAAWRGPVVTAMNMARESAESGQLQEDSGLSDAIEAVAPGADEITTMDDFYVQCVVVVADAALRSSVAGDAVDGGILEYALAPMRAHLSERDLGVLDVGSSAEESRWESGILADPAMIEAFSFIDSCISLAGASTGPGATNRDLSIQGQVLIPPR